MTEKDRQIFIAKANIYKHAVDKVKSIDDVNDKFYEVVTNFLTEIDTSNISDEFRFRSYKHVYQTITFFNDDAHNALICRTINSLAKNFYKKLGDKNLLDSMGKSLYFFRLGVDRYLVANAAINLKKQKYKDKEIEYLPRILEEYKYEIKQIDRDKARVIANNKITTIDAALKKETSIERRQSLYEQKLKAINAKAFGKKKSFEMKAGVCDDIINMYMNSTNNQDNIEYYKETKKEFLRQAALAKLHAADNNTFDNRKKYMDRFFSRD